MPLSKRGKHFLCDFPWAAFILAAELAFFAVQCADAHFLLLGCWFPVKAVMLNIDSRFSECS